MSLSVVDASVVIKWFVPEPSEAETLRLRSSGQPLHAPDFLDLEVASRASNVLRLQDVP
jgi:predicted nucleic acid-binding protein